MHQDQTEGAGAMGDAAVAEADLDDDGRLLPRSRSSGREGRRCVSTTGTPRRSRCMGRNQRPHIE